MKSSALSFIVFLLFASAVWARPVSYPGGWTIITEHNGEENNALAHYTVNTQTSLGYRYAYDREDHTYYNGVQVNYLVKRWNNPDSQANIYIKSSIGMIEDGVEGFTGMQADWENRRWMVMYENRVTESEQERRSEFHQDIGLGVAPYVAEFGSLHTWMMLHVMQHPSDENNWQVQPLIRFFKGTVLFETGYNLTNKTPLANAMIRF